MAAAGAANHVVMAEHDEGSSSDSTIDLRDRVCLGGRPSQAPVWHPLGPASGRPSRLPRQSPPAGLRQATTLNDPTGQFKAHTQGVRFYNRGIPDGYGWDRFFGLEPYAELEDANQLYRYDAVLVLDPLDTFEDEHDVVWAQDREIRRVHELIVQGYYDSGYSPVFVPADAPEERLDFICANLRLPRPSRED
jgi:hypothetical protein